MTNQHKIKILSIEDLEKLAALDAESFAKAWPKTQIADELNHIDARVLGYFIDDDLVGALLTRRTHEEWWIFRIMVAQAHRRKQIAQKLLSRYYLQLSLIHDENTHATVWLEVNSGNQGAISFYEKNGFRLVSERKGYYPAATPQSPAEDALVMSFKIAGAKLDYELIDAGNHARFERFGQNRVVRPDVAARHERTLPQSAWQANAQCKQLANDNYEWQLKSDFQDDWHVSFGALTFTLRLSQSKNVGLFPEQLEHWRSIARILFKAKQTPKVLNLFAYTGAASIVAAAMGAEVCHVDAAKSTVRWASENARLSHLEDATIRWIVDDARKFVEREIKRGRTYDALIFDPPPFGHGAGKQFTFEDAITELMSQCKQIISDDPLFVIFNCYALNYSAMQTQYLLESVDWAPELAVAPQMQAGTLLLRDRAGRPLSCNVFAKLEKA